MRSVICLTIIASTTIFASVMAQTTQPSSPEKMSVEEMILLNRNLQMEIDLLKLENRRLKSTIAALTGDRNFQMIPETPDPTKPLPKGWQERPFNDGTYYIVPLETPEAAEASPAK